LAIARGRVKLAFMAKKSAREAAYQRKKRSMMHKLNEPKVVHGIEAEISQSPNEVKRVPKVFIRLPRGNQGRRKMRDDSYLNKIIIIAKEQLKKMRYENRKKEMVLSVCRYFQTGMLPNDFNLVEVEQLVPVIDFKMMQINELVEKTKAKQDIEANNEMETID
jgi:hypothetical protein